MSTIRTISEFLRSTGAHYRIFDMGRRITRLTNRDFERIERVELPAPQPIQRHLCAGIVVSYTGDPAAQFVWFLHFPLDETGYLVQAARDEFLRELLERVGANIEAAHNKQDGDAQMLENSGTESRFAFTPSETARAVFHAQANRALKLPASRHRAHALDYLRGTTGFEQWAFVGVQGLADICADVATHEALLAKALPQLPNQPLVTLAHCLDSAAISGKLTAVLHERLRTEIDNPTGDPAVVAALLRASASSRARQKRNALCRSALHSSHASHIDVLATIAGRCWELLENPADCDLFLEALTACESGDNVFTAVLGDLLFLPNIREYILTGFRNPERSAKLSAAIGNFFAALHGTHNSES